MLRECRNAECKETFEGDRWAEYCAKCWRDVYKMTTRPSESKHPALRYERDHPPEEAIPATPEHAKACLAEAKRLLAEVGDAPPGAGGYGE